MKLRLGRFGGEKRVSAIDKAPLNLTNEILPDWKLSIMSFTYRTSVSPNREELTRVAEYLESAYGMRVLRINNRLLSGNSWTDENAVFSIDVTLTGN